ncbi:MAG: ornithine carbamoyltransferase [Rhizobiales bacterium]|nr:ornithine carbamoyltransferase [Hyphomicrobiales bacterium]
MRDATHHFIDICDLTSDSLRRILDVSREMKDRRAGRARGEVEPDRPLDGKILAMIFEQPSTRTRVSFDVAMRQLGGETLLLPAGDLQLGRGETIADTARVLSRYVDAVMVRSKSHAKLRELADHASVPVINALTDKSHPCQIMADIMTLEEHRGPLSEQKVAWVGDGNNVAASWVHAVGRLGGELVIACPESLSPDRRLLDWAETQGAKVSLSHAPEEAVKNASCIVTDVWVSMHDTDAASRHNLLKPYQVNGRLMSLAAPDAIFMHCLPAHRGEEVTADVIDGPQSVVFDEAENRLHAQKGILLWCLGEIA